VNLFADHGREQLRAAYREAWRKWQGRLPLQPYEMQLAEVIEQHPEYHTLLQDPESLSQDYPIDSAGPNPFLHLALHVALREQVGTDRPGGIAALHRQLSARLGSAHEAEHRMQEVLAQILWEAQRGARAPDEQDYLQRLRRLRGTP
jgi:Domain of unknown function (DUF1841)